jgi:RimJ/RimL family protein N-acetyltransferase
VDGLATERLHLEPLRVSDAQEMVRVLADEPLYVFIGGTAPTLDELVARYERQVSGPGTADQKWLNWIVRRKGDDRAVGFVQATLTRQPGGWVAELAWLIGLEHQGAGLATEAAAAAQRELRDRGVIEFRAHIADDNKASVAVATRLGLAPTDVIDDDGERLYACVMT